MSFNLTPISENISISNTAVFANTVTEGKFWGILLIALFFIFFMILKRISEFLDAVIVASFVCFLLSVILSYLQLVNYMFIFLFVIFMGLGLFGKQVL